jgi:hypothetical protein
MLRLQGILPGFHGHGTVKALVQCISIMQLIGIPSNTIEFASNCCYLMSKKTVIHNCTIQYMMLPF